MILLWKSKSDTLEKFLSLFQSLVPEFNNLKNQNNMNIPLEPGKYYHIFNHANGNDFLFSSDNNFRFFLSKYLFYIAPIAETLTYCLMPNHFHFLIRMFDERELDKLTFKKAVKYKTFEEYNSKQFSNLFSSYTQAYNKVFMRTGSLFLKNFKRKEINNEKYLRQLIIYIHNNPVKHGFTDIPENWKHSSYSDFLSNKSTFIKRNEVLDLFEDIENFKFCHRLQIELSNDLQLEE